MPGWDSVIGLILPAMAMILLVLITLKYRENRGMRLGLNSLLVATSAFRLTRVLKAGDGVSWVDAAALAFFGYAAISEAITLLRQRASQTKS